MQRLAWLGLLAASACGCMHPIKVVTEDRVSLTGPVAAELLPTSNDRPVIAMPVEGGPAACTGDLGATVYQQLGIDPETTVPDHFGRPMTITHGGQQIRAVLA
jgi:hypothetical protein